MVRRNVSSRMGLYWVLDEDPDWSRTKNRFFGKSIMLFRGVMSSVDRRHALKVH